MSYYRWTCRVAVRAQVPPPCRPFTQYCGWLPSSRESRKQLQSDRIRKSRPFREFAPRAKPAPPPARRDKIKIWFGLTVSGDGTTLKKTKFFIVTRRKCEQNYNKTTHVVTCVITSFIFPIVYCTISKKTKRKNWNEFIKIKLQMGKLAVSCRDLAETRFLPCAGIGVAKSPTSKRVKKLVFFSGKKISFYFRKKN